MPNAFGKRRDRAQVLVDSVAVLASQELGRVVCVSPYGGHGLVDLMGHAGRDLTQRGQLAGLHQLILHGVEPGFGALTLIHFVEQMFVHFPQLGGALVDQRRKLLTDGCLLDCAFAIAMAAIEHRTDQRGQRAHGQQGAKLGVGGRLVHGRLQGRQLVQRPAWRFDHRKRGVQERRSGGDLRQRLVRAHELAGADGLQRRADG
ncbi:hypothetical protein D3C72_1632730 [compost metagenome]